MRFLPLPVRLIRLAVLVSVLSIGAVEVQAQRFGAHTNHIGTQIEEIMVGANGDSTIQFIEISFDGCDQGEWGPVNIDGTIFPPSRAMLVFFDAAGNETFRFKFPNNVPCPVVEEHALIATQAFKDLPGAPTPDFIIPAKLIPISGKVCFRGNTGEASAPRR